MDLLYREARVIRSSGQVGEREEAAAATEEENYRSPGSTVRSVGRLRKEGTLCSEFVGR